MSEPFHSFIEENPGRQSISGSFNPIDVGEWSRQVYIGPTEKFFTAIVAQNRASVSIMIKDGTDLNRRDHVGRTPLHVAIISKSVDIACDLIDAGARMTARLVDGRTSLHLAAQLDQLTVVKKLLEKSAVNAEQVKKEAKDEDKDEVEVDVPDSDSERPSSEDDWSSEEDEGKDQKKDEDEEEHPNKRASAAPPETPTDAGDIPEDEDSPDVLDINLPDWDLAFTPLFYAVLFASLPVIEELLTRGADPKLVTKANHRQASPFHPLTLTILTEDEDRACKVAKRLLLAGATSSAADENMCTIFHRAASTSRSKIVSTLLRFDPNAGTVLNFPSITWGSITFPIVTTLVAGNYSTLAVMLAHGAKIVFKEEDVAPALASQ
jgi:ankyrin repeat protein